MQKDEGNCHTNFDWFNGGERERGVDDFEFIEMGGMRKGNKHLLHTMAHHGWMA